VWGHVTLRGVGGSITYGYLTAAEVRAWTIRHIPPDPKRKTPARWTFAATFTRADQFQLRQATSGRASSPLLFSAPRIGTWPLQSESIHLGAEQLSATLHPPGGKI
jgi:hypothetical protein